MPPRKGPGLSLQVPPDGASAPPDAGPTRADGGHGTLRDSFEMGSNGAVTVLTKSVTPYQFSSEGMIKAASRQQPQHHYRVSESDIFVMKTLGRGASSVVNKGFLVREARFVALKKINILAKDTRQQMMNDIKALCDAPNVPGLISFYGAYHVPNSGQISIVLEYMDGGSLADVLHKVGRIPEGVLSRIAACVLQGLAYFHRKHLVHRDIKPANILMNLQGEAKIADFGISAVVANTVANCNTFTGTVTYMSPERIEGRPYGFPADIWSLGLVLVEAATGRYPYDARAGPVELMIQVLHDEPPLPPAGSCSEELRDFAARCLAKDPKRRPNAEQLLQHPFVARRAAAAASAAAAATASSSSGRGVGSSRSSAAAAAAPAGGDDASEAKRFMAAMVDPLEKVEDIAFQFAWVYYAHLSKGPDGLRRLGGLYSPESLLSYQGGECRGRDAILAQQLAAMAGGMAVWRAKAVDAQPLGVDGTMLVHVVGSVSTRCGCAAMGGADDGAEAADRSSCGGTGSSLQPRAGDGGGSGSARCHAGRSSSSSLCSACSAPFAETFILKRSPTGEYFVTNQALRAPL